MKREEMVVTLAIALASSLVSAVGAGWWMGRNLVTKQDLSTAINTMIQIAGVHTHQADGETVVPLLSLRLLAGSDGQHSDQEEPADANGVGGN